MPCKPIALCSALLLSQKKQKQRRDNVLHEVVQPARKCELGHGSNKKKDRDKLSGKSEVKHSTPGLADLDNDEEPEQVLGYDFDGAFQNKMKPMRRSSSQAHREFLRATAGGTEGNKIASFETLPSSEQAFKQFSSAYPRFKETRVLDQLRLQEYSHLEDEELVCLDYCGFGLFTNAQREDIDLQEEDQESGFSSSFTLTEISANLWSNALFGGFPDGSMEWGIRTRIMEFLNISDSEYSMVFTASRGATFKLLADAYPWHLNNRLVTMYDYESESVGWMEQRAVDRGARVSRAQFRWPNLRVCSSELRRELLMGSSKKFKAKKPHRLSSNSTAGSSRLSIASWLDKVAHQHPEQKKEKKKGLFIFPVQSRVSGAKYSYQWMSLAQQNNWHVMLDASALGPKDMDSLGLSLFRPDFITASFYKLFGGDPSGFGCLLIKNSVAQSIQDPDGTVVSGMVRIIPAPLHQSFNYSSISGESQVADDARMVSSFSGPVPAYNEGIFGDMDVPASHECLENSACDDNYSSACEEQEIRSPSGIQSPVFSEDGNDFVDAGPSPIGSTSDECFSSPIRDDNGLPPASSNNQQSVRKDSQSSRSRIKGLCSGLLHLHTGRVGNSGVDVNSIKDGEKVYPEENDSSDLSLVKQMSAQKLDFLNSGKVSESHSKSLFNKAGSTEVGSKEKIPDKLKLVLRKVKEEQISVADTQMSAVKENEKRLGTRKGMEVVQQVQEIMDERICPSGLETIQEIEVEPEHSKLSEQDRLDSFNLKSLGKDSALQSFSKDSAICRETDGGFRLLGRRNSDKFSLDKIMSAIPDSSSFHCRSISSEASFKSDEQQSFEPEKSLEPQLLCRSLDHADMLGLNRTSFRLRFLINWLISSLLRLRHPGNDTSLVRIYGPQVRYDRGASVAFNIYDSQGRLLPPDLIRALADQFNIFLGLGFLRNIYFQGNLTETPLHGIMETSHNRSQSKRANASSKVEVLTAALGLLSDFRDVYRLWAFVARFLDPDYVTRELFSLQLSSSSSMSCRQLTNIDEYAAEH